MRKTFGILWKVLTLTILASLLMGFTGCDGQTSSAMCAFVIGDGTLANQNKLTNVIYPGQPLPDVQSYQAIGYIPCNARNYLVYSEKRYNANQELIGDRWEPIKATTKSGVNVIITANAYWTPNQKRSAMEDFFKTLLKYKAFSKTDASASIISEQSSDQSTEKNYSSTGWNGMLGEIFGTTMDSITPMAFYDPVINVEINDEIWSIHNPVMKQELSDRMSAAFQKALAKQLGYNNDIVCGSGSSSSWPNPDQPGYDNNGRPDNDAFNCAPVRIEVTYVDRAPIQIDSGTAGQQALAQQEYETAVILYGSMAHYALMLQHLAKSCGDASLKCNLVVGSPDTIPVTLPSDVTIPEATPAPTPTKTP
jgi:hypothetical protein